MDVLYNEHKNISSQRQLISFYQYVYGFVSSQERFPMERKCSIGIKTCLFSFVFCIWRHGQSRKMSMAYRKIAVTPLLTHWICCSLTVSHRCIPGVIRGRSINKRHYSDAIMSAMASEITSVTIVYSTVYSGANERKHQSSASLAFVREIHRWPVNSPHKGSVTLKMFPFDDAIIYLSNNGVSSDSFHKSLSSHLN